MREAREETGLSRFGAPRLLAEDVYHGRDETVQCYFVHLPLAEPAPELWDHVVTAGAEDCGMVFALFGATLPDTTGRWPHTANYVHLLLR